MIEQTFEQAVRESRLFDRRRLVERIVLQQIRYHGGADVKSAIETTERVTAYLWKVEDEELAR